MCPKILDHYKSIGRTLELLREVIEICWCKRPKRITWGNPNKNEFVVTASVQRNGLNFQHGFCELCWRYTEVENYKRNGGDCRLLDISLGSNEKIEVPSRAVLKNQKYRLSNRFCIEHRSTGSNKTHAAYRTDYKHKILFQQEITRLRNYYRFSDEQENNRITAWESLRKHRSTSNEIELTTVLEICNLSKLPNEEEIRKAAYDNVRKQFSKSSEMIRLYKEGLKQSEIARQLGVTRQAVSKVIQRKEPVNNPVPF